MAKEIIITEAREERESVWLNAARKDQGSFRVRASRGISLALLLLSLRKAVVFSQEIPDTALPRDDETILDSRGYSFVLLERDNPLGFFPTEPCHSIRKFVRIINVPFNFKINRRFSLKMYIITGSMIFKYFDSVWAAVISILQILRFKKDQLTDD